MGQNALIVAHGTSLRGLVKEIENMSNDEVNKLNLPTAIPFVYQLDPETLKPLHARRYLADDETVKKAVEKSGINWNKDVLIFNISNGFSTEIFTTKTGCFTY